MNDYDNGYIAGRESAERMHRDDYSRGLKQGYDEGWAAAEMEFEAETGQKLDRILDLLEPQKPMHIDPREPTPLKVGDEVYVTARGLFSSYTEGLIFKVSEVRPMSREINGLKQEYYVMGGFPESGDPGIWPKNVERTNGHPISYEYEQQED